MISILGMIISVLGLVLLELDKSTRHYLKLLPKLLTNLDVLFLFFLILIVDQVHRFEI